MFAWLPWCENKALVKKISRIFSQICLPQGTVSFSLIPQSSSAIYNSLPGIHMRGPWFYQIWKSYGQIAQGDDCVGSYGGIWRFLQNSKQQLQITFTEVRTGRDVPQTFKCTCILQEIHQHKIFNNCSSDFVSRFHTNIF